MRKKSYLLIAVVAIIIVTIVVAASLSTQNAPGSAVKTVSSLVPGNTFTYSIKGYADVIDGNGTIPASFLELNKTDSYTVTITSVSGGQVAFNTTWRFVNGTEINSAGSGDILTGLSDQQFWAIYPSNLTLNQNVRPLGNDKTIVNETETRTYSSGQRITNIMSVQNEFVNTDDPTLSTTYNGYTYVHFDKVTGMLVELKDIKIYSDPQIILTVDWQLQNTNVWTV